MAVFTAFPRAGMVNPGQTCRVNVSGWVPGAAVIVLGKKLLEVCDENIE